MTKRAVLVSFAVKDGVTHLSLDDAQCVDGDGKSWQRDVHYTSKPLTVEELQSLQFDEKELADFGYHILARLYAFSKRNELI